MTRNATVGHVNTPETGVVMMMITGVGIGAVVVAMLTTKIAVADANADAPE